MSFTLLWCVARQTKTDGSFWSRRNKDKNYNTDDSSRCCCISETMDPGKGIRLWLIEVGASGARQAVMIGKTEECGINFVESLFRFTLPEQLTSTRWLQMKILFHFLKPLAPRAAKLLSSPLGTASRWNLWRPNCVWMVELNNPRKSHLSPFMEFISVSDTIGVSPTVLSAVWLHIHEVNSKRSCACACVVMWRTPFCAVLSNTSLTAIVNLNSPTGGNSRAFIYYGNSGPFTTLSHTARKFNFNVRISRWKIRWKRRP